MTTTVITAVAALIAGVIGRDLWIQAGIALANRPAHSRTRALYRAQRISDVLDDLDPGRITRRELRERTPRLELTAMPAVVEPSLDDIVTIPTVVARGRTPADGERYAALRQQDANRAAVLGLARHAAGQVRIS